MHRSESERHGRWLLKFTFLLVILLISPTLAALSEGGSSQWGSTLKGSTLSVESSNITLSDRYVNVTLGPGRTEEQVIWIRNDQAKSVEFIISNRSSLDKRVLFYTKYSDNSVNGEYQNSKRAINMTTTGYSITNFNDMTKLQNFIWDHDILLVP
ncbi:MAG: hypothetical protein ACMUHB_07185, partial [Thermoplasmatota archaeon]